MPVIRLETVIRASPERCFDLSRSVDVHVASTSRTGERAVAGVTSGLMELGDEVTWEAVHLGVRQRLTTRITELQRPRRFVDEMVRGVFARMRHVHEFHAVDGGTLMIDAFDYAAPLGLLGKLVDWVFLERYMRGFLVTRNRTISELAEAAV